MKSVLVFLMTCMVASVNAQTASGAATDADFMRLPRASLISSLKLRPLGTASATERDIASIVASFTLDLPKTPEVWVCSGCGTSSHPEVGIIVDPLQLERVRSQSHVVDFHGMLTFILAHEAAHQMQFANYGRDLYKLPPTDLQIYEAQADILGGKFLYDSVASKYDAQQTKFLREAVRVVYDLGGEEYGLADHPSKSGRFLAARIGLQLGFIPTAIVLDNGGQVNANAIRHSIGILSGESDLAFSLRIARQIVQYTPVAAVDLVQIADSSEISWNPDPQNPFVGYSFAYQNRGQQALRVNMQVLTVAVPSTDPENVLATFQTAANNSSFVLQPGESRVVKDQLRWMAPDGYTPRLIYPPDPLGMIEVRYLDGSDRNASVDDGAAATAFGFDALPNVPSGERNSYSYVFLKYLRASLSRYASLRAGPGKDFGGRVVYPSSVSVPGATRSEVTIVSPGAAGLTSVRNTLLLTQSRSAADNMFQSTVSLVKTALASIRVPGGSGSWNEIDSLTDDEPSVSFREAPYSVNIRRNRNQETMGDGESPVYYEVTLSFSGLQRSAKPTSNKNSQ